MKKICFILSFVAAMFVAAEASAQIGVGVGYNHGTTTYRVADEADSDDLDGFYIEATYDWDFLYAGWGNLGIQPGVRFSYMGESDIDEVLGVRTKESINETYLDIPVHVKYSYDLDFVKLSAFAGPVFSFGLTSASKFRADDYMVKYHNYTGKTVTKGEGSSSSIPDEAPDYARFDLKLGLGLGATFMEKFNVKVGYNIGLLNRYTGEQVKDYRYTRHTGVFYLGVGLNF